jgi:hypothetical protein
MRKKEEKKNYKVTYTEGPHILFNKSLTKNDYVLLCKELNTKFNDYFKCKNDEYQFEPEAITEGGICFVNFPGKTSKMYKSMRHSLYEREYNPLVTFRNNFKWPIIDPNVMDIWDEDYSELIGKGYYGFTFLKAFYGAPVWTLDEINLFQQVMKKYGVKLTHLPRKTDLSSEAGKYM